MGVDHIDFNKFRIYFSGVHPQRIHQMSELVALKCHQTVTNTQRSAWKKKEPTRQSLCVSLH